MPAMNLYKVERIRARLNKGETWETIVKAERTSHTTIKNVIAGKYDNIDPTPNQAKEILKIQKAKQDQIKKPLSQLDPDPTINKKRKELKRELYILIKCLGYGHKAYLKFPQYKIKNSIELDYRIKELLEML